MWNSPSWQQQTTNKYKYQVQWDSWEPSASCREGSASVKGFHREILIGKKPTKNDVKLFKEHYGSDPAVLARMWHDTGVGPPLGKPICAMASGLPLGGNLDNVLESGRHLRPHVVQWNRLAKRHHRAMSSCRGCFCWIVVCPLQVH
jgi:hypothetical protein